MEAFLTRLATERNVAAGSRHQALAALLFLYREVLGVELPWMDGVVRAERPRRVPVVLTRQEAGCLLNCLQGRDWLMAGLLHGTGMRLMERNMAKWTFSPRFWESRLAPGPYPALHRPVRR